MKASHKWKDEYVFYIYDLTKDGHSASEIAKILGVGIMTLNKWKKRHPMVHLAISHGKEIMSLQHKRTPTFKSYVFDRLPKKLQRLWNDIDRLDRSKTGYDQVLSLLEGKGRKARQHLFLYAWTQSNFSISKALSKVCVSRATFEKWKRNDPDFLDLVQEIDWHKKNFFEDALTNLVRTGDSSATIFVNRTQNADRGYSEKMQVEHKHSGSINVNLIDVDELSLPLSVRKMILQAHRKLIASKEVKTLPGNVVPPIIDAVPINETEEGKEE